MYNTKQFKPIYFYSISRKTWLWKFDSESDLISFLGRYYSDFFGDNSCLNVTGNDTYALHTEARSKYCLRDKMFVNSDGTIADIFCYKEKALSLWETKWKTTTCFKRFFYFPHKKIAKKQTSFRYRIDPVPGLHKRCSFVGIRHPQTAQELRNISALESYDEEYSLEVRNTLRRRRKSIPTAWSDIMRRPSKCWKDQTKRQHQWR